jgi:hypothetical protein
MHDTVIRSGLEGSDRRADCFDQAHALVTEDAASSTGRNVALEDM